MFFDDYYQPPPLSAGKPIFDKANGRKINYDLRPINLFSDIEIASLPPGATLIFDVESYRNYFLIMFRCPVSGKVIYFEDSPESSINLNNLAWAIGRFELVGFNSKIYDIPMVYCALSGMNAGQLKEVTNYIIEDKFDDKGNKIRIGPKEVYSQFDIQLFRLPQVNHIDIFDVCPLTGSLKIYGGRLHCDRMQSLPYDPDEVLSREQATHIRHYCQNDLEVTTLLWANLKSQLSLRVDLSKQYGQDLRSKSDAQIAEAVIGEEIKKITGHRPKRPQLPNGYTCKYQVPDFIRFETPEMQEVLARIRVAQFGLDGNGSPAMPEELKTDKGDGDEDKEAGYKFLFRGTYYKVAMGGLHSCEKTAGWDTENGLYEIADNDVESYYPRIKINQNLYPKHIGQVYIDVYSTIVNRRVSAKRSGDKTTADSLKITINGAFGKLGSKWSILYSPDLMLQVTLSGQLCLLMLVERLELAGMHVISANTDGIVTRYLASERDRMRAIIAQWEKDTSFVTEETKYEALYSRDINNYFAVKAGKKGIKGKGAYANPWADPAMAIFRFHKNPEAAICVEAVSEFLMKGAPLADTITTSRDFPKFVSVMAAAGGAHRDGVYLGNPVRWYYAKGVFGSIHKCNGDKVNKSEGAKPCMDLPLDFPDDVNYDWYINQAERILSLIGYYKKPETLELFS